MWKAVAALLLLAVPAGAQERDVARDHSAADRARMAGYVAFVRVAAEQCAGLAKVPESWTVEAKLLSGVAAPPLRPEEIAAKEVELRQDRVRLGLDKWCALYAQEMEDAHLLTDLWNPR